MSEYLAVSGQIWDFPDDKFTIKLVRVAKNPNYWEIDILRNEIPVIFLSADNGKFWFYNAYFWKPSKTKNRAVLLHTVINSKPLTRFQRILENLK